MGAGDPCPCRSSLRRALHQAQDRCEGRHRRAHPRRAEDLPARIQRHRPEGRRQRVRPPLHGRRAFQLGELDVEVLHVPGHTPADVAYKIDDAVFVGDTLFMPDYGTARADFPGGDARSSTAPSSGCWRSRLRRGSSCATITRRRAAIITPGRRRSPRSARKSASQGRHQRGGIRRHARGARCQARRRRCCFMPSIQVNIRAGKLPPLRRTACAI